MKIYTKTGDSGETGLLGGGRVRKDDPRVDTYGQVDELCALIGFALALEPRDFSRDALERIQRDLFTMGAELATPEPATLGKVLLGNPIGEPVARTVCRRAERAVVSLARGARVSPAIVKYLNRLSDLLFVLARAANAAGGHPDVKW